MEIFENSCRVCLVNTESTNEDEKWISIYEKDSDDLALCDKITLCTGIVIDRDTFLAKGICKPCNEHLRSAYEFQKTCKQSDAILKDFIKNNDFNKSIEIIPENNESNHDTEETILEIQFHPDIKVEFYSGSDSGENTEYKNDNSSVNETEDEYKQKKKFKKKTTSRKKITDNLRVQNLCDDYNTGKRKTISTPQKRRKCSNPSSSNNETEDENPKHCHLIIPKADAVDECEKRKTLEKYEKESFICELCGNVYKKRALLYDHMRWHSGKKEFQCEICEKSFLLATYLARHMKTHTGIRNFQCSFCSRTFYTNGLKRAHEKVHTGERKYSCNLCNRSFSYSQSLQRHMMVHSGVKPFKCEDCGKEFRQETHLKQHLSTNIHQAKTAAAHQKS